MTAIKSTMTYGAECWAMKEKDEKMMKRPGYGQQFSHTGHGGRCETQRKTNIKIHGHHRKRYQEEWADSGEARGHGGHAPQTFGECFFSN